MIAAAVFLGFAEPAASAVKSAGVDPSGINDAGTVVGAFRDSSGGLTGFVYQGGGFTNFSVFSSSATEPTGVNDFGVIAGIYEDPSRGTHGFIDDAGAVTSFDVPGGVPGEMSVAGINDAGTVVGSYVSLDAHGSPILHGYIDQGGTFTTLDGPGTETDLLGVNDLGQIVGDNFGGPAGSFRFVYQSGSFTPVAPTLWRINDVGTIIGNSPPGFYVEQGGTTTTVTRDEPWSQIGASDINDLGVIVGSYTRLGTDVGFIDNGGVFTILNDPGAPTVVPEPAAWVLMFLGAAGLGGSLRRRGLAKRPA
jgi:hypothetical protein